MYLILLVPFLASGLTWAVDVRIDAGPHDIMQRAVEPALKTPSSACLWSMAA